MKSRIEAIIYGTIVLQELILMCAYYLNSSDSILKAALVILICSILSFTAGLFTRQMQANSNSESDAIGARALGNVIAGIMLIPALPAVLAVGSNGIAFVALLFVAYYLQFFIRLVPLKQVQT